MSVEHYSEHAAHDSAQVTSEASGTALFRNLDNIVDTERGKLLATVPLDLVYDDIPVDEALVKKYEQHIQKEATTQGGSGLITPVSIAHIPDFEEGFPVMDGFHRIQAVRNLGHEAVRATIRLNSTWADVYDQRIIATGEHDSLTFARLVEWVGLAWDEREAEEHTNLTALQAFTLVSNDRSGTGHHKLDLDQAAHIKEWVAEKSAVWQTSPATIGYYLTVARNANPELVKQVRQQKGRRTNPCLTPKHLQAITIALPGVENFALQNVLAEAALQTNLSAAQMRTLTEVVRPGDDPETARLKLKEHFREAQQRPKRLPSEEKKYAERKRLTSPELSAEVAQLREQIFEQQLDLTVYAIKDPVLKANLTDAQETAELSRYFKQVRPELISAARRIFQNTMPDVANQLTSNYAPDPGKDAYAALPTLEKDQREVLMMQVFVGLPIFTIARILCQDRDETRTTLQKAMKRVEYYTKQPK